MSEPALQRHLAAILAADVVGYSRLVAENEDETLRTLATYRATISDLVSEHGGRIFGSAGDSIVAEFASAVQAVRCAVAMQRSLDRRNADLPLGRRMEFRIGLNIGDVVPKEMTCSAMESTSRPVYRRLRLQPASALRVRCANKRRARSTSQSRISANGP